MSCGMKKKARITTTEEEEDRISKLPDELIHHILSFLGTRVAVRTSILSNRWKLIWTTLPFLDFRGYGRSCPIGGYRTNCCGGGCPGGFANFSYFLNFIDHVLSNRNHESQVLKLKLDVLYDPPRSLIEKSIKYAISHNVLDLHVYLFSHKDRVFKLPIFSSTSIEKLQLVVELDFGEGNEVDCWNLPALTTLDLTFPIWSSDSSPYYNRKYKLPEACLICLPSLKNLCLVCCELPRSSLSVILPDLTTLSLTTCKLPQAVWNFPALLSLELDDIMFPKPVKTFVCQLVSLQNLTLSFQKKLIQDCSFSCPRLVNLKISTTMNSRITNTRKILVIANKIQNVELIGIFPVTLEVNELENVIIKLWVIYEFKNLKRSEMWNQYYQRFIPVFSGLGGAQILTLDLATIEALSAVSKYFKHVPSPFYKLKCVKLPQGYKESSISITLRKYLLGGSPRATILTTLPRNNVISLSAPVSVTAQDVVLEEPLAKPTEELVNSQDLYKNDVISQAEPVSVMSQNAVLEEPLTNLTTEVVDSQDIHSVSVCVDTVDMRVQEEHVVSNSGEDADRVGQIEVQAPVTGAGNDRVCSSSGNSDYGLWQGHEVNSEFVSLLNLIIKKYPETFEHFTSKSKKFYTMKLNMLCCSVNAFIKTSLTDVTSEMIIEYRDVLAEFQRWGLNVNWLTSRLNYIEELQFSHQELHTINTRIDDANSELQDLQTRIDDAKRKLLELVILRVEKMTDIEKVFGNMGTRLAASVGYIGDGLFSGP